MSFRQLYDLLFQAYGPQGWWPGGTPFEVTVGAILTQATAWSNVERAIQNLKAHSALSLPALLDSPKEQLEAWLRPCGYFRVKAERLRAFLMMLEQEYGGSLDRLFAQPLETARAALLDVRGIGPETADSILLYAGNLPVFVVDAYTYRLLTRLGWWKETYRYEAIQQFCTQSLLSDPQVYNEAHALIVRHGHTHCRKKPLCTDCPVRVICSRVGVARPAGSDAHPKPHS